MVRKILAAFLAGIMISTPAMTTLAASTVTDTTVMEESECSGGGLLMFKITITL